MEKYKIKKSEILMESGMLGCILKTDTHRDENVTVGKVVFVHIPD